jgi:hypothetical protein
MPKVSHVSMISTPSAPIGTPNSSTSIVPSSCFSGALVASTPATGAWLQNTLRALTW